MEVVAAKVALYTTGIQMDIEIIRPKQYQDKIRNYHLIIDGKPLSKLKPNSTLKISIPDDAEYIQAKIDWCTSPRFYIKDIKSNKLIVKNRLGGNFIKALFMPIYYITFGKNKYLAIESGI